MRTAGREGHVAAGACSQMTGSRREGSANAVVPEQAAAAHRWREGKAWDSEACRQITGTCREVPAILAVPIQAACTHR